MTTPPSPPKDRRVLKTHRALREALIGLILEQGWDQTSVNDVCVRADVGRSTFYTHFADKEELLLSGFDDLFRALRASSRLSPEPLGFAGALIEHVQGHLRLSRALLGKRSGEAVQRRLRKLVSDLLREDLARKLPAGSQREAAVQYISGGFLQLLAWWLDSRTGLSAEELEGRVHGLTRPLLQSL